jgi:hypothetical protein
MSIRHEEAVIGSRARRLLGGVGLFWVVVVLMVSLVAAPFAFVTALAFRERSVVVHAVQTATRYAGRGVPASDVVRVLGEPESVFYKPAHFERPVRGRLLRYRFGLSAYLYVYIDSAGVVECALVDYS